MRIWKTSLMLACLSIAGSVGAQFEKGDWLIEGGFQTHLEGSLGKTDIDLSKGGFTYYETDSYGFNVSAGRFFWEKKEMGLLFEEYWSRQRSEEYRIGSSQSVLQVRRSYFISSVLGVYFRQYLNFGKGWFGGFLAKATGGRTWYTHYYEEDGIESGPYGSYNTDIGLHGNLFVAKRIGKHFGGRVSFGNIGYSIGTKSAVDGIWYTEFDFNFQNLINPNISILWTFHGKSKKDRD